MSLIRKFFLLKEIVSKEGVAHFRRYRLLSTPWFNVYVHNILRADEDKDPHDHPWHYASFILWGGYTELWRERHQAALYRAARVLRFNRAKVGDVIVRHAEDFHKISSLKGSTWTLVFTFGKRRLWGYQTPQGWIDFKTYRQLKNERKL